MPSLRATYIGIWYEVAEEIIGQQISSVSHSLLWPPVRREIERDLGFCTLKKDNPSHYSAASKELLPLTILFCLWYLLEETRTKQAITLHVTFGCLLFGVFLRNVVAKESEWEERWEWIGGSGNRQRQEQPKCSQMGCW